MFSQIVEGRVQDAPALRAQLDAWAVRLAPAGWLGTTAGVTAANDAVVVTRYASPADAAEVSIRPEQEAWWADVQPLFTTPVTIHDCPDLQVYLDGGSDDAGLVQVVRSGVTDPHRQDELAREFEALLPTVQPGVIGFTIARHEDGGATQVLYFVDAAAARQGEERRGAGDDLDQLVDEWGQLLVHPRVLELPTPWLWSPLL